MLWDVICASEMLRENEYVFLSLPSVPAAVSDLRLDNDGSSDCLIASWVSPEGGVDAYLVTLSALGSAPQERRLAPNNTRVLFQGLTPGRSYQLSVRAAAAGKTTEARTSGRTGMCWVSAQTTQLCSV